jgi:hypothetical protein
LIAFLLIGVPCLVAQAPVPASYPAELPRFTLRQIITGRNDSTLKIPGAWAKAAAAAQPESIIIRSYTDAASRSRMEPLSAGILREQRSHHVLGLYRRSELLRSSHHTLETIRAAIPSDTTRARFDRIFRPRGEWIVDLHDAALAWARMRVPGLTLGATRDALRAAHWWRPSAAAAQDEALLRAFYGLSVLAATDSTAFAAARAKLGRADSTSAEAAIALLTAYTEAQRWYASALEFFLREPWIPGGHGQSIRDLVQAEWRVLSGTREEIQRPVIETRWFGYPQAVPQYSIPPALFRHLVAAENSAAEEWLQENGEPGLLRTLRWLPQGDTVPTTLRIKTATFRLTSVARQARESLNGFLEPRDVIAIDPGYAPLLALGAVVHEWQHLIFRRRQLELFASSLGSGPRSMIRLPGVEPHLAEGFAEWSSERILTPVTQRWALVGLGELEKRADLIQRDRNDHHVLGYELVRALAAALPDAKRTIELLLHNAEHPSGILSEPAVQKIWSRYRGAPDRILSMPRYRMLIPEVTFTVEDGFPEVTAMRILVPESVHSAP